MTLRRRIVEELCNDSACPREGAHWHRISVNALLREACGEYTLTIRVRMARPDEKQPKRGRPPKETFAEIAARVGHEVARAAEDAASAAIEDVLREAAKR